MTMDEDSSADSFFEDLLHAVDQQLDSPSTRYVRETFDRLLKNDHSEDEARERIAECLAEESDAMFRSQRPFDEKSYRARLDELN